MKYLALLASIIVSTHSFTMETTQNQKKRGILIAIEGIDGSGKSTLAQHLYTALQQTHVRVALTKEPGDTIAGKKIRELVQTQTTSLDPKTEFLLFAADRAEHFSKKIKPLLEQNCIIISDRLADSSLAYQGYGRGLDKDKINTINAWAMDGIKPDLTIFVKIPVEVAIERITKRNENISVFEKGPFLANVARGFEKIYRSNTIDSIMFEQYTKGYQEHVIKTNGNCVNLIITNETDIEKINTNYVNLITIDGTKPEEDVAQKAITTVERWIENHWCK